MKKPFLLVFLSLVLLVAFSGLVSGTELEPPAAPSGLSATANTSTQITLNWTDNSDNEDGFKIERKQGSGSFADITTVGAEVTSFADTGLTPGMEYTYRIRAYNAAGNSSYSDAASATTLDAVPNAPDNLKANVVSGTRIDLTWRDRSGNETGFKIERRTGSGSFNLVATVDANVTTYSDTGLNPGTQYTYRVCAYNSGGDSGYSSEVSATTTAAVTTPAAPDNLSATMASSTRINLTWRDRSDNETGFKIERKKDDGRYAEIATVTANTTSYSDTGLEANTKYVYRVRAYNAAGNSSYSNEASATTATLPNAPTDLKAETVSGKEIKLTWRDRSDNETGFKIERKKDGGRYEEIAVLRRANVTTYTDTGLTENTKYVYRVRAYNAAGDSSFSNEASATTGRSPNAPTDLKAEAVSNKEIKLTWRDRSDNETGFKIERKKDGGNYAEIATVRANVTTYNDSGLEAGTKYVYRVRAYNATGNSDYSNEANATTKSLPEAPANLRANAVSEERINLTWSDRSDNETGFKIERRKSGGRFVEIATVRANVVSYSDRGLEPGTTYSYRVRAYNTYGNSGYTNESVATTQSLRTVLFTIGENNYTVNGMRRTMDASPIITESRTLLPVRFVAESLGAAVTWDERARKVTITHNRNVIELWIDQSQARVNGRNQLIDPDNPNVKPIIVSPGRTMLPLRFISESLGCQVDWNERTREVKVTLVE